MARAEGPVVVLLPIKPRFAEPIMSGRKQVEFRKTCFTRVPSHVVVYASSPVQKVLGYFAVSGVDVATVEALWAKYSPVGGIAEADFAKYYAGREAGVALGVGLVTPAAYPVALADLGMDHRPPQNFAYVDPDVLHRLHRLCDKMDDRSPADTARRRGRLRCRASRRT